MRKTRAVGDPYRLLAAAILKQAGLDVWSDDQVKAVKARRWLVGNPWARYLCDVLDRDRGEILRAVARSTRGRDGR